MEDKSVRISEDTHQRLVDFIVQNPVLKMNKLADIAISSWLQSDKENKVSSIMNHLEVRKEHG